MDDPRAVLLKKYAADMAVKTGFDEDFDLMERIERMGIECSMKSSRAARPCAPTWTCTPARLPHAGHPDELFTAALATARIAGWCAHRIEELLTGGRIMRPAYPGAAGRGVRAHRERADKRKTHF